MTPPREPKYSNRSRGHRSPLDKLPAEVISELSRRCYGEQTLASIRDWLLEKHGCKTSLTSISDWWKRRIAAGYEVQPKDSRTVVALGFEFTVIAPGAESITVRVHPAQKP